MLWFMRKYCPFKAFFEKLIYFTLRNNREFKQITTTIKKKKKNNGLHMNNHEHIRKFPVDLIKSLIIDFFVWLNPLITGWVPNYLN